MEEILFVRDTFWNEEGWGRERNKERETWRGGVGVGGEIERDNSSNWYLWHQFLNSVCFSAIETH